MLGKVYLALGEQDHDYLPKAYAEFLKVINYLK